MSPSEPSQAPAGKPFITIGTAKGLAVPYRNVHTLCLIYWGQIALYESQSHATERILYRWEVSLNLFYGKSYLLIGWPAPSLHQSHSLRLPKRELRQGKSLCSLLIISLQILCYTLLNIVNISNKYLYFSQIGIYIYPEITSVYLKFGLHDSKRN